MKTQNEIDKTQQGVVRGAATPEPFLEWKYELNEETGKNEFKSIDLSDGSKVDTDNLKGSAEKGYRNHMT